MADSLLTLAEVVHFNDVSIADMGASDVFNDAPFLASLNAIIASHGSNHQFLKEVSAPAVGFRQPGAGRDHGKSADQLTTVGLSILDASFHVEKALAKNQRRGIDWFMAREAKRHIRAAFSHGEKQLFYGTDNDADGFNGLADELNDLDHAMVIAAGTPAASQNCTDVWAVRSTDDERFLSVCVGHDGEIEISESYEQMLDGSNSKKRNVIVQPIEGWAGLVMHSAKSVARLANIDDSDSKLTDALLYRLWELFDENNPPTQLVMNKRSGRQLRESRVATTESGKEVPLPKEWEGIPIVYSKSVGYYTTANAVPQTAA